MYIEDTAIIIFQHSTEAGFLYTLNSLLSFNLTDYYLSFKASILCCLSGISAGTKSWIGDSTAFFLFLAGKWELELCTLIQYEDDNSLCY